MPKYGTGFRAFAALIRAAGERAKKNQPQDYPAGSARVARLLLITLGRCAAREPLNSRSRDGSRKGRSEGSTCDKGVRSHCAISSISCAVARSGGVSTHLVGPLCCESLATRGQAGLWRAFLDQRKLP